MDSGLSDVAKTKKTPKLKNVGAMSDNPIERTCGRRRDGTHGGVGGRGLTAPSYPILLGLRR